MTAMAYFATFVDTACMIGEFTRRMDFKALREDPKTIAAGPTQAAHYWRSRDTSRL